MPADESPAATRGFEGSLARAMAIASGAVIPPGLALSAVFGGLPGFAGALAGFGVASLHSAAVIWIMKWARSKPPRIFPTLLWGSYFARIFILLAALYGLHFIKALNMVALLCCFLALYLAHTGSEILLAWKSFGVSSGRGGPSGESGS